MNALDELPWGPRGSLEELAWKRWILSKLGCSNMHEMPSGSSHRPEFQDCRGSNAWMNIHGGPLLSGDGKPMTAKELRQHNHLFTYPASPPPHYAGITRGWPIDEALADHDTCISWKRGATYSRHQVNRMLQRRNDEELFYEPSLMEFLSLDFSPMIQLQ